VVLEKAEQNLPTVLMIDLASCERPESLSAWQEFFSNG